ncbi:uncharacterized protein LOC123404253 isoform X2 [Hordeum vulgare subsp. vulgare]|uniref:uncharacterized protein LOC123404253 isoform X2 n=1 Tax=Hordeum vulgare subsp. vulgare TaxID=112509 RepID=UPI001D1A55C9|nr:uncharacterized protein LOC123404253 isoform X2 [Hordeum vulgare subsp. vulgare]XP_044954106.1 uncharacterized protein LOC123404253 isoform X2 [Hordeum vulgare subsp. vulgare]
MEGADPRTGGIPPSSSDIPYGTYPSCPAPILSMHHHLAGFFDHLSEAQQVAAMSALRRCDDDIHRLVLNICDRQMMVAEEIKSIVLDSRSNAPPPPPPPSKKAAPTGAQFPLSSVETDSNMHEERQHPCPTTDVANSGNVMLNEGRDNVLDTCNLSCTQILMAAGFLKSRQDEILDGTFGSQWNSQCIYNDPSHEVLWNGMCKTCYDNGEMGNLYNEGHFAEERVDSSTSADEEFTGLGAPIYDETPKEHENVPPIVFDKTPDDATGSLTRLANITENVMEPWKESPQLRDAAMKKMVGQHECVHTPTFDQTPEHLRPETRYKYGSRLHNI